MAKGKGSKKYVGAIAYQLAKYNNARGNYTGKPDGPWTVAPVAGLHDTPEAAGKAGLAVMGQYTKNSGYANVRALICEVVGVAEIPAPVIRALDGNAFDPEE